MAHELVLLKLPYT